MTWPGPLRQVRPGVHDIDLDYRGRDGGLRMRVPGRVIASGDVLAHIKDDQALEQVANVASLPGIVGHSLAMPDAHWGYGFPIGGVAAFDPDEGGIVSPGGVGFDINCGVRVLAVDAQAEDLDVAPLVDALYQTVPAGMGSRGKGISPSALDDILAEGAGWAVSEGILDHDDQAALEDEGCLPDAVPAAVSDKARVRGQRSIGSLGSGNHFLEVQAVDELFDAKRASTFGLRPGQVLVMIHSGSRGLGHQVCQDHVQDLQGREVIDRQLAYAELGTRQADAYLGAMAAAANFAYANRSILAARATEVFDRLGQGTRVLYDVCHNIAKWEEHQVDGQRRRVLVHRKGATRALPPGHALLPARYEATGQPVLVPGDMGRASYILAGAEGAKDTFNSSCHGAGRRMGRNAAKRRFDGKDLVAQLQSQGIHVRATSNDVAAEEAPLAYKDVSDVVACVELAGLATRVARLRPLGVVKG